MTKQSIMEVPFIVVGAGLNVTPLRFSYIAGVGFLS